MIVFSMKQDDGLKVLVNTGTSSFGSSGIKEIKSSKIVFVLILC